MAESIAPPPEGFIIQDKGNIPTPPAGFSIQTNKSSPGFFSRVKSDVQNRFGKMGEESARTNMEQQTGIEGAFQNVGHAGGLVNDVGSEALVSVGKGVSAITPDPIKQGISNTTNALARQPIVQAGVKALQAGEEAWKKFSKDNPRVADDLSAALNIAGASIPVGKTMQAAEKAAPSITKGVENVSKTIDEGKDLLKSGSEARSVEDLQDHVAQMKKDSAKLYKQSRALGARFTPQANQNIINNISSSIESTGKLHPRLHGDTMSFVDDIKKDIQNNGMDLERLDQHRQWLREVEMRNTDISGKPNTDAHKAGLAIKAIDDSVENLKPSDIAAGDPKAVTSLLQARSQWKAARKFETVTDAIAKADGDISKAKANIKKLTSGKKSASFTKDEIAALKKASDSGTFETIAKMIGKVGIDEKHTALPLAIGLGSAALHAPGGLPLVAAGTGAKAIQKLIGRGKIEEALKSLDSGTSEALQ